MQWKRHARARSSQWARASEASSGAESTPRLRRTSNGERRGSSERSIPESSMEPTARAHWTAARMANGVSGGHVRITRRVPRCRGRNTERKILRSRHWIRRSKDVGLCNSKRVRHVASIVHGQFHVGRTLDTTRQPTDETSRDRNATLQNVAGWHSRFTRIRNLAAVGRCCSRWYHDVDAHFRSLALDDASCVVFWIRTQRHPSLLPLSLV